ncbi:hypothetical protein [Blastococcus brunescens]|uniref:Uncharacterized protein n=1 Tax=Blastococcus brunescens TaxID=1564165 RepID=A0ABZ1B0E6_9ACTN|nr:hypothetical protein [Blastococcus sp. BMG 8361]WRL64288.1 hypothetical protein U6N30_32910 [Blastococcus sp. BMG 8361]
MGWEFLKAALSVCEHVDVLTRQKNVQLIREALSDEQLVRCRLIGFDLGLGAKQWKKRLPLGTQAYYAAWQIRARSVVRRLHEQNRFDLAHHVTFATDYQPVVARALKGVPFVWGPVGV